MTERDPLHRTLDAVLLGNADAFMTIVQTYSPGLRAFLASQLFDLESVDDLAQETLIAAYRGLHTFRREEDFGAWLRGIARNKLRRHFEQTHRLGDALAQFRTECTHLLGQELEAHAEQTRSEHLQTMLSCIARLPERMRKVVRAHLEGNRAARVAEELGMTPGAVYQLQYRALQMLRECLLKEGVCGQA